MRSDKEHKYQPTPDDFEIFRFITTAKEAAAFYHFSIRTIQMWCDEGRIAAIKIELQWVISVASINQYVRARE